MVQTTRDPKSAPAEREGPGIARRVKQLRLAKRMLLKDLAAEAGCSESLLSRVENNRANPSLATAHRLAKALGVSMVALFEAPDDNKLVIYTARERISIGRGTGAEQAEVLIPPSENRLLEGFLTTLLPGAEIIGPFQHEGEEVGYVLEGELELVVGDSLNKLKPGDSFFFRSDISHGYRNAGDSPCRVVWINTPQSF